MEQEMETYKLLYLQMEQERDNLTELLSQNCDLPTNVQKSVAQRLELLNKFLPLISPITMKLTVKPTWN